MSHVSCIAKVIDVQYVLSACVLKLESGMQITVKHADNNWKMVYVEQGSVRILSDTNTCDMEQDEMYIHHVGDLCFTSMSIRPASLFVLTFASSSQAIVFFESRRLQLKPDKKILMSTLILESRMMYSPQMKEYDVTRPWRETLIAGDQSIAIRLELLIIELLRENQVGYTRKPAKKDTVHNKTAMQVIQLLESNLHGRITLDQISQALNYSKSYLVRLFKTECGFSIMEYFMWLKIDEAKRQIREDNKSFTVIYERMGFDSLQHFSIRFKQFTGVTPSEYRRSVSWRLR